ncbi:UDP-N-acetylglucosamine--N-acetylmuramyl-(pentapeptide) pyrophosphoryl-undecaprenol N-acetylglucosamine transferase [Candidatus Gottesmanbacteria bacterium]|nr:UDP-N-acetylglucosamine--N-acetylmuramyl-(pentapeptide) pyrophosphoryl-undecaprenol N-acetylglucosamine transferase [Candidatus Gottesmanbacteria bacterium]
MLQHNKITICIAGGHLTPALAVIEEIKRQKIPWKIVFIGRSRVFEGDGTPSQEERLVKELGVPFHTLTTGRLQRVWSAYTLVSLMKVPIGFFQSLRILLQYRPADVLSFGGYIALPVVVAAWICRIPVITHEQTEDLGLANSIIARFARCVLLSRESGVPIRRTLFDPPPRPSFSFDAKLPLLYITGGSTGARTLNALVFPTVTELIKTYMVIHQVGARDISEARKLQSSLPKDARSRYIIADYFDDPDIAWIYHHTALLVGRAGANTAAEVAAIGIPALLVPLPWAAGDEQTKNARRLAGDGMAVVLEQQTLSGDALRARIGEMMSTIHIYKKAAQEVAKHFSRDGAINVINELKRLVPVSS